MAKHFKDFNKEVKDFLTKNYEKSGEWKIENKTKCTEDKTLWVNPKADAKGISVDVEFNVKEYNIKTKTNVSNGKVAPKVTYECCDHKVDVGVDKLASDAKYEVEYEGTVAGAKLYDKLTPKDFTCGVGYKVAKFCQVGASATIALPSPKLSTYSFGARYLDDDGRQLTLLAKDLKHYTTGAIFPLPEIAGVKAKLGAQVDCGHKEFTYAVGLEFPCLLVKDATWKLKVNEKMEASAALLLKLNDKWKAAISTTCAECCKFGVSFTRE